MLVTHEHPDHIDIEKLTAAGRRNSALRVHMPTSAVEKAPELGDAAIAVEVGQRFTAAGFTVDVVGGAHAEIYDGLPGCANVGFIVDGDVYHPGDALSTHSTHSTRSCRCGYRPCRPTSAAPGDMAHMSSAS